MFHHYFQLSVVVWKHGHAKHFPITSSMFQVALNAWNRHYFQNCLGRESYISLGRKLSITSHDNRTGTHSNRQLPSHGTFLCKSAKWYSLYQLAPSFPVLSFPSQTFFLSLIFIFLFHDSRDFFVAVVMTMSHTLLVVMIANQFWCTSVVTHL